MLIVHPDSKDESRKNEYFVQFSDAPPCTIWLHIYPEELSLKTAPKLASGSGHWSTWWMIIE